MIVVELAGRDRLITQTDHARLAAEVLSLWRADGMPEHPRRRALLRAVAEHDNGWREADAAPRADPVTGRPLDYRHLDESDRRQLWRRGAARFFDDDAYVALLVLEHAMALHRDLAAHEAWAELYTRWREESGRLLAESGLAGEVVAADYRLLALADTIALGACDGWERSVAQSGYRLRFAPGLVTLVPLPLAGATRFSVPCRHLPRREYRSDSELGVELASARWERLEVRLAPGTA